MKGIILYFVLFQIFYLSWGHLLPEESDSDVAEQLNREKRDDFLNSILKTIPFFNVSPSKSSLKDEDDPNDAEEESENLESWSHKVDSTRPNSIQSNYSSSGVVVSSSHRSQILSATIVPSPTLLSSSSVTFSVVQTPSLSTLKLSSSLVLPTTKMSSSAQLTSKFHLHSTSLLSTRLVLTSTESLKTLPVSSTLKTAGEIATSSTYLTASSTQLVPSSSLKIEASSVIVAPVSASAKEEIPPLIQMMIMSADESRHGIGPTVPDEVGYGDTLARPPNGEEMEIKNIHFLYSNVLIPVMSGILGALLITCGIVIYKCMRKRKLQKVRYFGGKSQSGLYRLDQMSLLSELTSDEEE